MTSPRAKTPLVSGVAYPAKTVEKVPVPIALTACQIPTLASQLRLGAEDANWQHVAGAHHRATLSAEAWP